MVSVIIPVFNAEKYIARTLISVVNQTYNELEIIVILDGSTDGSAEIIKDFANRDKRIVVFERENKGVFYTRVEGIQKASSSLIMFVDADDWIEPDTIKYMHELMVKTKVDIVKCSYIIEKEGKKDQSKICVSHNTIYNSDNRDDLYDLIFKTDCLNTACTQLSIKDLYRDIDITSIDKTIVIGEDMVQNIYALKLASSILIIPNTFYHYNQTSESATRTDNLEKRLAHIESVHKYFTALYEYSLKASLESGKNYSFYVLRNLLVETSNHLTLIMYYLVIKHEPNHNLLAIVNSFFHKELILMARVDKRQMVSLTAKSRRHFLIMCLINDRPQSFINYVKYWYVPCKTYYLHMVTILRHGNLKKRIT